MFDDSRLDDPVALEAHRPRLERIALAGARIRQAFGHAASERFEKPPRPRSVVLVGAGADLVRFVAGPVCPAPVLVWDAARLPGWLGTLDLVVVLAGRDPTLTETVIEASRRGACVLVIATEDSPLVDYAVGSSTTLVTVPEDDPFTIAVRALDVLGRWELSSVFDPAALADRLDVVADECGPVVHLGVNRAKGLACALGETTPLIWGESPVTVCAATRIACQLRKSLRRPALAAGTDEVVVIIEGSGGKDLFADPFDDPASSNGVSLLLLSDSVEADPPSRQRQYLVDLAGDHGVRVAEITTAGGDDLGRFAALCHEGAFAAAYLEVATL
ncbi:MAG: hypothetical protein LBM23_03200 [Propionibacteriaceae bacterium]|nr:hypothetical protein [Propionibacteriaceae bacterium]